jgi:trehalose 6-phosphate phosphatase
VVVDGRLAALMRGLAAKLHGRVAIISGRSVAQIDSLFANPSLAVGGSHGLELRWPDGHHDRPERPATLDAVVRAMRQLQREHPGIVVEEKPYSAALHYRLAPQAEDACLALGAQLSISSGLPLQRGKMMLELRAAGADKGGALRAFMAKPEMAGHRPIFIGDDETDEHAFAAAADLGGAGILVGPFRRTAARFRLSGVDDTLAWLGRAAREAA